MQQQPIQGFPKLNTPLKIITKLNNMLITISDGWHGTKADAVIVDKAIQSDMQRFRILQCDNSKIYYIVPVQKDSSLSARSGWSDMVYSEVKIEKLSQDTNQLWRIVPYHHAVYTESAQKQQLKVETNNLLDKVGSTGSSLGSNLGYEGNIDIKQVRVQQKTGSVTTSIYKLGYQFESGPQVQTYSEVKTTVTNLSEIKPTQPIVPKFDIANPPRFPIKQKCNLEPIDLNNDGWFFIENVKFNLVLEVEGGIDGPGMSVVLNRLNGNRNQLWRFQ